MFIPIESLEYYEISGRTANLASKVLRCQHRALGSFLSCRLAMLATYLHLFNVPIRAIV